MVRVPTTEKGVLPTILAERLAETVKFDAVAARPGNGQPQDIATDIAVPWGRQSAARGGLFCISDRK
jgi:hypothetical protein